MSAKIPYSTFRPGVSHNLYANLGGKIIRRGRRYHRYKGYRSGLFSGGSRRTRFSNRRLFLTLIVIAGSVALMVWGLSYAKGAV